MNPTFEDKDKNVKDGVHNKVKDFEVNQLKKSIESKLDADRLGVANGVAPLGADGKIPGQYFQESEEAEDIPIVPSGDLEATNVQDAITELEAEKQPRLGFNPENVGNKATNLTQSSSNTAYPSVKAVVDGDNATLNAAKSYSDSIQANVLNFRGYWNPTGGTVYPTTGGTGVAGAIVAGNTWEIDTIGGGYDIGDLIVAKIATPGQTAGNWGKTAHNTQQATEVARGTAMLATTAEMQDAATTNDIDMITPKKLWSGLAHFVSLAWTFALKITFTLAPRFSSVGINHYLKVTADKDLTSVAEIPGNDVTSATDTTKGAVELATLTETKTGTDAVRAVTPAGISSRLNRLPVAEFKADFISSSTLALSGVGQVVQGHPRVAGEVGIVNAQSNPLQNGVYVVNAGAWLRIGVSYNDDVYNYAGDFEGLRMFNRADKKYYRQISTAAEITAGGQNWVEDGGSGSGGGGDIFTADIICSLNPGETFGKYKDGDVIPANGKTGNQIILDANTRYKEPTFSALAITGQATSVESGDIIALGVKAFTWATTNATNIASNSLAIRNQSANTDLVTGLANDGAESVTVPADIQITGDGSTQVFRIVGTKANGGVGTFNRDLTITAFLAIFYGPVAAAPANSAAVRAMTKRLRNAGNVWQLNTGTVEKIFAFWLPTGRTLVSVIDKDAVGQDITASYVSSALTVKDAANVDRTGTLYVMTSTVPYGVNHRHEITIS